MRYDGAHSERFIPSPNPNPNPNQVRYDGAHSERFITPQMRASLLDSSVRLTDQQRVELGKLAKAVCPTAVKYEGINDRETKVDIDALDPKSFILLDVHVRSLIARAAAPTL